MMGVLAEICFSHRRCSETKAVVFFCNHVMIFGLICG